MGDDTAKAHEVEGEKAGGPGQYDITIELTTSGEYRSREEAIQHARKIRQALKDDSAVDHLTIGRVGVLRSKR